MGRIRKCKLSWKPSESRLVAGYRLYWSNETPVNYNANFIELGNVTEVNLPDILMSVAPSEQSVYLGISAVDEAQNESDLILLPEAYYLSVPPAPVDLVLTSLDDFKITKPKTEPENQVHDRQKSDTPPTEQEIQSNPSRPVTKHVTTEGKIVDDFTLRFRNTLEL